MTVYTKGNHTVYYHRYHISWITKYRYKVLTKEIQIRVKEVIHQVAKEMGIKIETGVLSSDHLHLFVEIPPHVAVSEFVQKAKGRSSRKVQLAATSGRMEGLFSPQYRENRHCHMVNLGP